MCEISCFQLPLQAGVSESEAGIQELLPWITELKLDWTDTLDGIHCWYILPGSLVEGRTDGRISRFSTHKYYKEDVL